MQAWKLQGQSLLDGLVSLVAQQHLVCCLLLQLFYKHLHVFRATGQGRAGQKQGQGKGRAWQGRAGQDRAGQGRTGQDRGKGDARTIMHKQTWAGMPHTCS